MGISLSLNSKSNVDLSNEGKDAGLTWDEATWTWDEEESIWDLPKLNLSRDAKSNISLSLDAK